MGGHLVRVGGVVLAALTIAAGGMTVGVGTAGALLSSGHSDTPCPPQVGPWFPHLPTLEEILMPCDEQEFFSVSKVGNAYLGYRGPDAAAPGQVVDFEMWFSLDFPLNRNDVPASQPDRVVTTLTHHVPRGFEFRAAEVRSDWIPLDATTSVDPVTGDVTITAPSDGWVIPNNGTMDTLNVTMTYAVTEVGEDGASRVGFTGTDSPVSGQWAATGNTRAHQDFMEGPLGSASLGSTALGGAVFGSSDS
ncbi:conserved exported hypothetical protein [Rhodococcus sp. RD6.2]|uniref:hypothetical protein n=1 Tax=Rhodococcus sp. RD6.2 TaxID=260936 RepID=UPI00063B1EF6|nr:hypothetical protein [Rhodococcus sp. RD6.2]CRK53947.1 conserved exported hypothetical protein [Rhodococcus sp. RD6.2]